VLLLVLVVLLFEVTLLVLLLVLLVSTNDFESYVPWLINVLVPVVVPPVVPDVVVVCAAAVNTSRLARPMAILFIILLTL